MKEKAIKFLALRKTMFSMNEPYNCLSSTTLADKKVLPSLALSEMCMSVSHYIVSFDYSTCN
jgi:hypothetical protein